MTIHEVARAHSVKLYTVDRIWKKYLTGEGPIENLFAQWKQHVRAGAPRNEGELLARIYDITNFLTREQCHNYITRANVNAQMCVNGENYLNN